MAFNTTPLAGASFNIPFTPGSAGGYLYGQQPPMAIGTPMEATDGGSWVYCLVGSGGITGPGYVVTFAPATWTVVMLSTGNDVYGNLVGVSPVACAAGDYSWIQVGGTAQIRCEQDALANNPMGPTADLGQVDDASATIGALYIRDMTLTTARGGTDGLAPGILTNPIIDLVADTTP